MNPRPPSRAAFRGAFRKRPSNAPRPRTDLPVHQLRCADARPQRGSRPERRDCALCLAARQPVCTGRGAFENLQRLRKLGALGGRYGFPMRSTSRRPVSRKDRPALRWSIITWPTTTACRIAAVAKTSPSTATCANSSTPIGDRGRRTPAAGKGSARNPGHERQARGQPTSPASRSATTLPRPKFRTIDNRKSRIGRPFSCRTAILVRHADTGGAGYSRWNGQTVCPLEARSDRRPATAPFIFLRDMVIGRSGGPPRGGPRRAKGEVNKVIFGDDRAEFYKTVGTLMSHVEVITRHRARCRRPPHHITNLGHEDRHIELTSYLEPVILDDEADIAISRSFRKCSSARNRPAAAM